MHLPICASAVQSQQHPAAHPHVELPSLMMRLIDDFLMITPSHAAAEALALRLVQGETAGPCSSFLCVLDWIEDSLAGTGIQDMYRM